MNIYLKPLVLLAVLCLVLFGVFINKYIKDIRKHYIDAKVTRAFPVNLKKYALQNEALPQKHEPRIVLFGDSRVEHWKPLLSMEGFEVLNRGIAAETTQQMRLRFQQDVLSLNPDILIIQAGINDLVTAGLSAKHNQKIITQLKENLNYFIEATSRRNIKLILMTVVMPSKASLRARILTWPESIYRLVPEFNRHILTLSGNNAILFESNKLLGAQKQPLSPTYAVDSLHFTNRAYKLLNKKLSEIIRGLNLAPTSKVQ